MCPPRGTELEQGGVNLLLVKQIFFGGSKPQFYIFLQIISKGLRDVDTHEPVKLCHLLFTGIRIAYPEMQQKAEERAQSRRMDERNVKAMTDQ